MIFLGEEELNPPIGIDPTEPPKSPGRYCCPIIKQKSQSIIDVITKICLQFGSIFSAQS